MTGYWLNSNDAGCNVLAEEFMTFVRCFILSVFALYYTPALVLYLVFKVCDHTDKNPVRRL